MEVSAEELLESFKSKSDVYKWLKYDCKDILENIIFISSIVFPSIIQKLPSWLFKRYFIREEIGNPNFHSLF